MADVFDTLLLLALPASGKSEVRTFLTHHDPEAFHMGPTIQLDDYPYVHFQLRIDEELVKLGQPRVYHEDDGVARNGPFLRATEWGALIHLLNEDYHEILQGEAEPVPERAARRMFERLDQASVKAGGPETLAGLPEEVLGKLEEALEAEARELFQEKLDNCPPDRTGKTIVIEFARGGPEGASMPLPQGYGYAGSLSQMSPELLERACILYIWVTPEESRRKNRARARPGEQGSILFHGTPESVMYKEYGCDDMEYLMSQARIPGTLHIESHGMEFDIPMARFDNREDKTSFLREPPETWKPEDVQAIAQGLKGASDALWETCQRLKT